MLRQEGVSMSSERDEKKTKGTYEKPRLRTIELVAEEVLAIGCKLLSGSTAPLSPTNCVDSGCSQAGS